MLKPEWTMEDDAPPRSDDSAPCWCRRIRWAGLDGKGEWKQVVYCPTHSAALLSNDFSELGLGELTDAEQEALIQEAADEDEYEPDD